MIDRAANLAPGDGAVLAFSPGWYNLETPPTGVAYLARAARDAGFPVSVIDANRDYISELVQPESGLDKTLQSVQNRLSEMHDLDSAPDAAEYAYTVNLAATPIEVARDGLTTYTTWLRQRENEHGIFIGHRHVDASFSDKDGRIFAGLPGKFLAELAELDVGHMLRGQDTALHEQDRLATMRKATEVDDVTVQSSIFDRYMLERFLPYVEGRQPSLVGISINAFAQIKFALRMAAHVRKAFPELPVLLGGNQTHFARPIFEAATWLSDIVRGLVIHEGEKPFVECLRRAGEPETWGEVANVRVYEGDELLRPKYMTNAKPEIIPLYQEQALVENPLPYTSERRAAVLSRGCYWAGIKRDGCLFCTHHVTFGKDYRRPEAGFPLEVVKEMYDSGIRKLHFVDETLPPNIMRDISEGIVAAGITDLEWGSYVRFERPYQNKDLLQLMRNAGCRLLEIGLESASQRVLDAMDKGINIQSVRKALDVMLEVGIQPSLFIMFGFPTETPAEAEATLAFIEEYSQKGVLFNLGVFELTRDSPALRHQKELGIELLVPEDKVDLNALVEGVHYRTTIGNTVSQAIEYYRQALQIIRKIGNKQQLWPGATLARNAFIGTTSVAYPELLFAPEAITANPFNAVDTLTVDVFGPSSPSDLGPHQPDVVAAEQDKNPKSILIRAMGESLLTTPQVLSFINAFSKAATIDDAIDMYSAAEGIAPDSHREALYALAEKLVAKNILVVRHPSTLVLA